MKEKAEGFAEAFTQIVEKLAGKESDLELVFTDLGIEFAGMKPQLNGKVSLNIKYYTKEKA